MYTVRIKLNEPVEFQVIWKGEPVGQGSAPSKTDKILFLPLSTKSTVRTNI